jgi:PEP-CTERM motif
MRVLLVLIALLIPMNWSLVVATGGLVLMSTVARSDTIITGDVCGNTCFNFRDGDNTPVLFDGLPWRIGSELSGPFVVDIGAASTSVTIDGGTLTWLNGDPHYSVSLADPSLGFGPDTYEFVITGLPSSYGYAGPMHEFLCDPATAVPEPRTWLLMLLGFAGLGFAFRQSRRRVSLA